MKNTLSAFEHTDKDKVMLSVTTDAELLREGACASFGITTPEGIDAKQKGLPFMTWYKDGGFVVVVEMPMEKVKELAELLMAACG